MHEDPWLERWIVRTVASCGAAPVLELGCGSGADTAVLAGAGLEVIALELDAKAADRARQAAPSATVLSRDIRDPWPVARDGYGAVVASLSLHYFPWADTMALVARIREALRPGGLLLCRLNSTEDYHYGASGHPKIEDDYYLVEGEPKRFFDAVAVDRLFATGWRAISKEHYVTAKYANPKALWEIVLERDA
ncbi:MAG: class I SAM-dependent methyltransferase [Betaproteobacteria bacterium]|nr:class I SAM-dependent methyltransferase [Betaproteobacteria bacterium]